MKMILTFSIGWLVWLAFANAYSIEKSGNLTLKIDNVRTIGGTIWVGIYDDADHLFVKEKAIVKGFNVGKTGTITCTIEELPYGTYAVALFHDVNSNGELDRNLAGIPTEPFAFSQKPKSRWRLPYFEEVKFAFLRDQQVLQTRLKRWWE